MQQYKHYPGLKPNQLILSELESSNYIARVWARDNSIWGDSKFLLNKTRKNIEWLRVCEYQDNVVEDLNQCMAEIEKYTFTNFVFVGIGASLQAKEIFFDTFSRHDSVQSKYNIYFADSILPTDIHLLQKKIENEKTLYVIISRSGSRIETLSIFNHFWSIPNAVQNKFLAITTEGSLLAKLASRNNFLNTLYTPPRSWERLNPLTCSGLLLASLMDIDIDILIERSKLMLDQCAVRHELSKNPGIVLGALLFEFWGNGRDKMTLIASKSMGGLSYWIEQLVAEGTGKNGKGIIPIDGENMTKFAIQDINTVYGKDRFFVDLRLEGENEHDKLIEELKIAGFPVITIDVEDQMNVGQELVRWGFAVMTVAYLMKVNPFDAPQFRYTEDLAIQFASSDIDIVSSVYEISNSNVSLLDIQTLISHINLCECVCIQAFLPKDEKIELSLNDFRLAIRDHFGIATTVGFGPNYMHSTGQMHKGGPKYSVYIQIYESSDFDLKIPNTPFSMNKLVNSQILAEYLTVSSNAIHLTCLSLTKPRQNLELFVELFKSQLQ